MIILTLLKVATSGRRRGWHTLPYVPARGRNRHLSEASNCLLSDGGIILQREPIGTKLICKVLYAYTCLRLHLHSTGCLMRS